jgi:capsular polysaccharide biosynthesis protein
VDPATLAFADQVQLFSQADVIVGAHGSAFANLIWCRPGTRVVDLMPDNWVNFWGSDAGITEYWVARICALTNLEYSVILCASDASSTKKWSAKGPDYVMESTVDVELLDRTIDSILNDIGGSSLARSKR